MKMVEAAPEANTDGVCRQGTVRCTLADLERVLGPAHSGDYGGGKVTANWNFETPRGPAQVGDYWWNQPTEQSVRARSHNAALWLTRYLRRLGFAARARTK